MQIVSKQEIVIALQEAKHQLIGFCTSIDKNSFFHQPTDKWSIAQNVTHLTVSARITRLAYSLPKFVVRLYGGKPNRKSRSYDELVAKYKFKLEQGGRASGPFIPKPVSADGETKKVLAGFTAKMDKLIVAIEKNWTEEALDNYLARHPLLGRITLRELGYFTIYHTYHHLEIIKRCYA